MNLRFRKSIRLFPGVKLNLSGGRISTTIGVPGASLNLGMDGRAHMTLGIPGSGLSYRAILTLPRPAPQPLSRQSSSGTAPGASSWPQPSPSPLPGEIKSAAVYSLTRPSPNSRVTKGHLKG
jgi:hypothetical protein